MVRKKSGKTGKRENGKARCVERDGELSRKTKVYGERMRLIGTSAKRASGANKFRQKKLAVGM